MAAMFSNRSKQNEEFMWRISHKLFAKIIWMCSFIAESFEIFSQSKPRITHANHVSKVGHNDQ